MGIFNKLRHHSQECCQAVGGHKVAGRPRKRPWTGQTWVWEWVWLLTQSGPNSMALLAAELCTYEHHSLLTVPAPKFWASCVSKKYIEMWSTPAQKQNNPVNLWTILDVSTECSASPQAFIPCIVSRAVILYSKPLDSQPLYQRKAPLPGQLSLKAKNGNTHALRTKSQPMIGLHWPQWGLFGSCSLVKCNLAQFHEAYNKQKLLLDKFLC